MANRTQTTRAHAPAQDRRRPRLNPLWAKSPLLLLRYPGLFASIAVGAALLALAAAAYPLFISASASELVAVKVEDPLITRWGAGYTYRNRAMPVPGRTRHPDAFERTDRLFRELTGPNPYLDPTAVSILGPTIEIAEEGDPADAREVRIFAGDGADGEIEILAGAPGDGALVPDTTAEALGIGPGDRILLESQRGGTESLSVDGVYRSLYKGGASGYWRTWYAELIKYCGLCPPPPQPLILSRALFLDTAEELKVTNAGMSWMAPLDGDLTLEQAEDAAARSADLIARMGDRQTVTGRLFTRCYLIGFCGTLTQASFGSSISDVVVDVHRRVAAVESPAKLLRAAGLLVALAVVAAAGAFAMAARRVESALLFARGARPLTVAGRAMLEAGLPVIVGASAGLGLAFAIVAAIGPGGAVSSQASGQAWRGVIVAGAVAVLAIGVVSTASFLRHSEHHRGRLRVLLALPLELALIGLSLLALDRLRDGGAIVVNEALQAETPSLLLLAFPVLFLAGFVALAARLIVILVRWLRGRSDGLGSGPYLAVHRLAARSGLTLLLVTAAGLCLGLFAQARTVAGSMQTTVHAKAQVYVGSDVQVRIEHVNETPTSFPLPLTRVVRDLESGEFRTGLTFDLLAIDPATFADAAFWDDAFASEPLEELIGPLDGDAATALPAVLAAWSGPDPTSITINTRTVPIRVVGRAVAFPGMSSLRPLVVVHTERFTEVFEPVGDPLREVDASVELWIRGGADAAATAVAELPYLPELVLTSDEVEDIPHIAAVIEAFLVMNGLGLAAALLVVAAMLMYLQARQRSQVVSYGLSLRMGMRGASHFASVVTEVGAILLLGYVVGVGLAVVAARLVVPLVDPIAVIPPAPLTVVPVVGIAIVAPLLVAVALAGGWLTERRARRADLGQVMRLAD